MPAHAQPCRVAGESKIARVRRPSFLGPPDAASAKRKGMHLQAQRRLESGVRRRSQDHDLLQYLS
jgi:hypothetical protein